MKIDILTLFPYMFTCVFGSSILKKAQEKEAVGLRVVNFRDYTTTKHNSVDNNPYGGVAWMVLTPQPIFDAVEGLTKETERKPRVVLRCPPGERFTQKKEEELAEEEH